MGVDNLIAGVSTIATGEHHDTLLHMSVAAAGKVMSTENAQRVATATELLAGLGTSSADDALRVLAKTGSAASAIKHGSKFAAVQAGGVLIGAGIGYTASGTLDGALMGASLGQMAGGIAANAFVKCFVAGTLVWVPADDGLAQMVIVAGVGALELDRGQYSWQTYVGLGLIVSAGVAYLALSNKRDRNQESKSKVVADSIFENFQWSQEDPFGLEELACERVEATGKHRLAFEWQ